MSDSIVRVKEYFPGDLLWSKCSPYPYWPCMVTYHPYNGVHVKKSEKTGASSYHVQYFGTTATRGWTGNSNFFPFEGKNAYFSKLEKLKLENKPVEKYKVKEVHRVSWEAAVKEANDSRVYKKRRERFEEYVFRFEKEPKKEKTTSDSIESPMDVDAPHDTSEPSHPIQMRMSPRSIVSICKACGYTDVNLACSNACGRFFHMSCYGFIKMPIDFNCVKCLVVDSKCPSYEDCLPMAVSSTSSPLCFECKLGHNNDTVIKCAQSKCLNYYHISCLSKSESAIAEKDICSLHTCYTCYKEDACNMLARKGPMVRCVQCPYAFHSQETCVPPGAVTINEQEIICPFHFGGKKKQSSKTTCNSDVCSVCQIGGVLICCGTCPNALHKECIPSFENTPVTSGDFVCPDCDNRQYLKNGDILWSLVVIELEQRWWPAKIIRPSKLPESIQNKKHQFGEFVVKYYGLSTYAWTHMGRVFKYTSEHLAMEEELIDEEDEQYIIGFKKAAKKFRRTIPDKTTCVKPQKYKQIRVNRAVPPAQIVKETNQPCSCNPTTPNPCGPESICINRSLLMECSAGNCKAEDLCQNQKFQKREYAETTMIRTPNCGFGLASVNVIKKGEFIIEYIGQIITHNEYQKRSKELFDQKKENYYFLYLDAKRMIDAGRMGNLSRFINHSCEPNCQMMKWIVNGDLRMGVFAIRNISPGEELSFDYKSEKFVSQQQCFCGATNCKKYIGRKNGRNGFAHRTTVPAV